jgi:hypothetical protein
MRFNSQIVDALPNLGVSGSAAAIAELVTLPLDTAKVMQFLLLQLYC